MGLKFKNPILPDNSQGEKAYGRFRTLPDMCQLFSKHMEIWFDVYYNHEARMQGKSPIKSILVVITEPVRDTPLGEDYVYLSWNQVFNSVNIIDITDESSACNAIKTALYNTIKTMTTFDGLNFSEVEDYNP